MSDDLQVFISYARADSTDFVDRLEGDLAAQQFRPWVDRHGLQGGQAWLAAIQEAIEACQALVVVISPAAVQSEYVHMEYHYAKEERKHVIPLMWGSVKIPMDLQLTQCLDFQASYDEGLRQLVQVLNRVRPPAALPPEPAPPPPAPARRPEPATQPEPTPVTVTARKEGPAEPPPAPVKQPAQATLSPATRTPTSPQEPPVQPTRPLPPQRRHDHLK